MSRRRCTGTSKRTGQPCGEQPMRGRNVCYHHGGKTPRGIASVHTRSGRHSKDLPTRLIDRYQAAQQDPVLLELRDEISLLDARLGDLLSRVETGESGALWSQLGETWQAFARARASGKVPRMTEHLADIEGLIIRGAADHASWSEIGQLIDRRTRLVESERKRQVEMQQTVSLEQAMLFLAAVTDAVRRHVTDRPTLMAIGRELELLGGNPDGPIAVRGGRR